MLKTGIFPISVVLLTILLLHCKKSTPGLNITLYDKPLSVIQVYINGKWNMRYEHGGVALMTIQQSNIKWEFGIGNRVTENYHGQIIADTNIPWVYVIDGIYNDTLLLHDNAVDGFFYHFTKSN